MDHDLTAFGRHIREHQERYVATVDVEATRRRLLEEVLRPRPSRLTSGRIFGVLAVAAAVFVFIALRPPTLHYRVGDGQVAGSVGTWISAEGGAQEIPLSFSDGTRIVLSPGGRALVAAVNDRPRVVLDHGHLEASVVHRVGRRWRIAAGPFEVTVTGTRFEVGWDPGTGGFFVALLEGRVLVSGPVIGRDRPVQAGETLAVSAHTAAFTLRAGGPPEAPRSAPGALPDGSVGETAPPQPPSGPDAHRQHRRARELVRRFDEEPAKVATSPLAKSHHWGFVSVARSSRYDEALKMAIAEGFAEICAQAQAGDLMLLGDAARFAGDRERARVAYAAIQTRFAGPLAARAAFLLARMLPNDRDHATEAARLYETYLTQDPTGPLEREAIGLLAEAQIRAGDAAGAKATACGYLDKYPQGPFATRARALCSN